MEWAVFEEEFGPLTVQERIDWLAAMTVFANSDGQGQLADFLPRWEREPKAEADLVGWLMAKARR